MEINKHQRQCEMASNTNMFRTSVAWAVALACLLPLLFSSVAADNLKDVVLDDLDLILEATNARTVFVEDAGKTKREISPIGFVAGGLLTIYQKTISSQDRSVCNFNPSCSRFAREAISQVGMLRGSLMAADRILRCHPYSLHYYHKNPDSRRVLDPVEDYLEDIK